MSLLSRLFGRRNRTNTVDEATLLNANVCPNCWGKQEYDNQFVDYIEDQTKANINHDKSNQKAFVQQFVETNVTGIQLKREGDMLSFPRCKVRYKHVSDKAN